MLLSGMQHSTYAHAAYGNMVLNTWIKEIADVEPSHPRVDKEMVIPVPQPGEEGRLAAEKRLVLERPVDLEPGDASASVID